LSKRTIKKLININISAYAAEGKSLARLEDGKVIFVENAIPGDTIDLLITKDKKSWAEGRMTELITPSPDRITPFCQHFGICGGCKWQMLPYQKQLEYKQQQVNDQLQRIGQIELPPIQTIIGSKQERFYRNKLEFTFSQHRYLTHKEIAAADGAPLTAEQALGFHAPGLFDKVVPISTCWLQGDPTNKLLEVLRQCTEENNLQYYNYKKHEGWLRNVVLRIATTGEILLNIVMQHEDKEKREALLEHLLKYIPGITTLHYTFNSKVNDSIHDIDVHTYFGKGFIEEQLEDFRFKISPKSFFQTNTYQAETLYKVTREFAGLIGNEILYDLYCGTGSIGIFCSKGAKKVIGIEVIEEAIADAKENATMNNLKHCQFYAGDIAQICNDAFFAEHGKPDVIITDPPRAGMHEKLVKQLLAIKAPKIVYVSCNPATQARDLQLLDEAYKVTKLQPVDMFPHTHHIENVALLELKIK